MARGNGVKPHCVPGLLAPLAFSNSGSITAISVLFSHGKKAGRRLTSCKHGVRFSLAALRRFRLQCRSISEPMV